MPVTYLNSSTLSEALDKEKVEFAVGSTANISVGDLLVITDSVPEACRVRGIPISGRVQVIRGANGTEARSHLSGAKFWIGSPEKFKAIRDNMVAVLGNPTYGNLPDYVLPGLRARDGRGNEFIMVDSTYNAYSGIACLISNDGNFTAAPCKGGSGQGAVGVFVEEATSDQWAWAQIYGYNSAVQCSGATTGATSASVPIATTVVSSPNVGFGTTDDWLATTLNVWAIHGMFIVGGGSSAVTSATSQVGYTVPVFLNYPYVHALQYEELVGGSSAISSTQGAN